MELPDTPEGRRIKTLIMIYVWREKPALTREGGKRLLYVDEEVWKMLNAYVN